MPTTNPSPHPVWRENISVLMLDGQSIYARPVGYCLGQSPGLRLHVLSLDRRPAIRFSRHVRSFATYAQGELVEAVERFCAHTQVDVLFPVDEVATGFLGAHGARMPSNASCHLVPAADKLRLGLDKWALAECLRVTQVPHPHTVLGSSLAAHLPEFRSDMTVLLKPRDGGNGRGIRLFSAAAVAADFLTQASVEPEEYIVQECITGYDIDCSVLCRQGEILAFTIQRPVLDPAAETKPSASTSFKPAGLIAIVHDEEVLTLIRRLVAATGWDGIAHIDCRYDERSGEMKVIEINPRYWGSIYGSLSAGVNFPVLACQAALGVTFPVPDYTDVRYASGAAALKQWHRLREVRAKARRTAWSYLISDPVPELFQAGKSLLSNPTKWLRAASRSIVEQVNQ